MQSANLDEALTIPVQADVDIILLDQSLNELAAFDSRKSRVWEMRFFGGLSAKDIAALLNTTEATVSSDWNSPLAWLYHRVQGETTP
jgi:DNA-directed RNA polymerase specialized sigma subunit